FFSFLVEDGIRDFHVTGVQTCALPISTSDFTSVDLPAPLGPRRPMRSPASRPKLASWRITAGWPPSPASRGLPPPAGEDARRARSVERRVGKTSRRAWLVSSLYNYNCL